MGTLSMTATFIKSLRYNRMKRLFTFAIVGMIATLAFAQSQFAEKRAPRTIERAANYSELMLNMEAAATAHEKAAVADEVSASKFIRSNKAANGFESFSSFAKTLNGANISSRTLTSGSSLHFAPAKEVTQEGNVTITTDENGIIRNVEGGETRYYQRDDAALTVYVSGGSAALATQSGNVEVVVDGNNYYFKDIITRYNTGAWVKGVKAGNTITIAPGQLLNYSTSYSAGLGLRWAVISAGGSISADDAYAENITFSVDDNVLTLEGSSNWDENEAHLIAVLGMDDDSFYGYGDFQTVLTYDDGYVPPSTELVELPEDAVVEDWFMNAVSVSSSSETPIQNQAVEVAFVGSDVYVQGLFTAFPTAWVKGTIDGTEVAFDNFQYIGAYSTYSIWMIGVDPVEGNIVAPTATYDSDAKTITFDCSVIANAAADRVYYLAWLADVVVSADEIEFEEPIITDLTAELPYLNTFESDDEKAEVAIYDANNDGKTFSFYNGAARYQYNSNSAADDYLVFPGVELEAGVSYSVSFDTKAQSATYVERVELVAGKEAKASQLNITVIEPTEVNVTEYFALANGDFKVEESGTYYFAIHAISEADKFYLYVDNFQVKENDSFSPAAASDFDVVADAAGAKTATISFTVPNTTVGGDAIEGNLDMTLKQDGEVIAEESLAAGKAYIKEVEVPTSGMYTFTVSFSYEGHPSEVATVKVYIGVDKPGSVENLTLTDKATKVGFTWDAPTAGANGYPIIVSDLTYNVYPVEFIEFWGTLFPSVDTENPLLTGLTATQAEVEYDTNEGEMAYTYFAVAAENELGVGATSMKAMVTGAPYELPIFESAANKTLSYWWATSSDDENYYADGGLYYGQNPSDGDEGCFAFTAETAGWITLESGKIALAGASNPIISFDVFSESTNCSLKVSVVTPNGEFPVQVITPAAEYENKSISLVNYANEPFIRIIIKGEFDEPGIIELDNIKILNQLNNNLVAKSIKASAKATAGDDINVDVVVENQGSKVPAAGAYTVDLYVDGEVYESAEGVEIASFANHTFSFAIPTSIQSKESMAIKAIVKFEADEDPTNNETAEVTSKVILPKYPVIEDLEGEATVDGIKLTWSEPNTEINVAEPVTDDFESYAPFEFNNNIGDWTLVDVDQAPMGGIQGIDLGALEPGTTLGSFFVMNNEGDGFNESFDANSGVQYLSTMFAYDGETFNNDWLISPVLSGDAQTISLFAKSYVLNYGAEKFAAYYSTTDQAIESFIKVQDFVASTDTWEEYTFDVPAGAKYFAIQCVSEQAFMLFIDDITYLPANGVATELPIVGYNIYRDGVKLNAEPVGENEYLDSDIELGTKYSYAVSTVFDLGESKTSEAIEVTSLTDGVFGVSSKIAVKVVDNMIVISGAENASIASVDGKVIYDAAGNARVAVAPGVYVVKADKKVCKVIVK